MTDSLPIPPHYQPVPYKNLKVYKEKNQNQEEK